MQMQEGLAERTRVKLGGSRKFSMWLTKIAKTQRKENVCAVVCLGVRTSLRRPFGRYGKELATERPRKLHRGR
jgi:hypothetical protein